MPMFISIPRALKMRIYSNKQKDLQREREREGEREGEREREREREKNVNGHFSSLISIGERNVCQKCVYLPMTHH